MKQLLSLFLLLLPCLVLAQYPSNGNQKITLGEQTTADGLIFRGVASTDTVRKPSIDTMTYMVLDTTTNIMWHYKKATSNAWLRLNLLPSDTASMLTNYWRSGRFSGTLPVANGGTNASTFTDGSVVFAGASGTYTQDNSNLFFDNTNDRLGIGTATPTARLSLGTASQGIRITFEDYSNIFSEFSSGALWLSSNFYGNLGSSGYKTSLTGTFGAAGIKVGGTSGSGNSGLIQFYVNDAAAKTANASFTPTERMRITGAGNVGIGTISPQSGYRLHVVDSVYVGGNVSASAYTTRSDYNLKDDIFDLKYGLNDVLQLQPVEYTYKSNGSKQLGFIAQDIGTILPEVVSFEESMSVNYQAIIPILTKAIQEQQALIKALEQRIFNLENK
jgi:hypothetical protein